MVLYLPSLKSLNDCESLFLFEIFQKWQVTSYLELENQFSYKSVYLSTLW